jgi:hypothetical protein
MGNAKQRHRREDSRLASRLLTCYDSTCVCTTEQAKKATSFEMTSTSINLPSKRPRCLTDLNLIISSLLTPPGTSQIPVCHLGIRGHTPPKAARTHLPIPIDERISERITKKVPQLTPRTAWHSKMYVNNHGTHAFVGCRVDKYPLAVSRLSTDDVGGSKVGHAAWRNVGFRHVALPCVLLEYVRCE